MMKERAIFGVVVSPMTLVAGFAVIALVGTGLWQATSSWRKSPEKEGVNITKEGQVSPNTAINWQTALDGWPVYDSENNATSSDPDGLSNISGNVLATLAGSYVTMKNAGIFTQTQGEQIAEAVGRDLQANISHRTYSVNDVQVDADTSLSQMLAYRNDLRIALEPLLKNSSYELDVFAAYIDTGDKGQLTLLQSMADNYRAATENAVKITVPENAVSYHLGILNALSEFESVLEKLAAYADDPYASAALLRTFNGAESNVFASFDALAGYFRTYTQS